MKTAGLIILALALLQQPQSKPQNDQTVRIGTAEVALDIVVRDKKGRPVKDLTEEEFEIFEDGARQKIESFRLVARESGPRALAGNKAAADGRCPVFKRLKSERDCHRLRPAHSRGTWVGTEGGYGICRGRVQPG